MKKIKFLATVIIVAGCVSTIWAVKEYRQGNLPFFTVQEVDPHAKGNPKAKIKIVEFVDYQCPSCAKTSQFLNRYADEYPDKLYIRMKYFPLRMHRHSMTSAMYAECAAMQEKFWPFQDLMFKRQPEWKVLDNVSAEMWSMAQEAGLDMEVLKTCLSDPKTIEIINNDKSDGISRGIQSTPTLFFNDKMVVGYDNAKAELQKIFPEGLKDEVGN